MITFSLPDNYSSAYTGAIYTIDDTATTQPQIVEVLDSQRGETLGFRRVQYLNNNKINLVRYLARALNPQPILSAGWSVPEGRTVEAQLLADDTSTERRIFTASLSNLTEDMLLSSLTHRTVSPSDLDEISLFASAGQLTISVAFGADSPTQQIVALRKHSGGLISYVLDVENILQLAGNPDEVRQFWIYISLAGKTIGQLRYSVVPASPQSVRLGWLNPYGAIDYHTFRSLGRLLCNEKERVMTGQSVQRVTTVRSSYVWEEVLSSGYLPATTATALSGLLSSPRVWRVEDGEACLVDVTEEMVAVSDEEQLSALRFSVREAEPHQTQFF